VLSESLSLSLNADVPEEWAGAIDLSSLDGSARAVLLGDGWVGSVEVELLIVDETAMHELNLRYRGVDAPTDVLSFPLLEEFGEQPLFVTPPDGVKRLGDIVISLPRAQVQAAEYGHSARRELTYLFVHGLLHLLGYQHEDEAARAAMRVKEESALAAVGLSR
jgi:probable rRNA maturation factor